MWYLTCGNCLLCILVCLSWTVDGQDSAKVYFPGELDTAEERKPNDNPPSVLCEDMQAFWPATNTCEPLLQRGPCKDGQWLLMDRSINKPVCQYRPCSKQFALWNGVCVHSSSPTPCGDARDTRQRLYHNKFGEPECDCMEGNTYWLLDGKCYPLYRRGPCSFSHHLVMDPKTMTATCTRNPCIWDRYVLYNKSCHLLQSSAFCNNGILDVDQKTFKLGCVGVSPHAIIDVPSIICPAGSRRDVLGRCSREMHMTRGSTFFIDNLKFSNKLRCPPGLIMTPRGKCQRPIITGRK